MNRVWRELRWMMVSGALLAALLSLGSACLGQNPLHIFRLIGSQVLFDGYGLGSILYKATTLIFSGLACALAFRCGLFNIGAEGQLYAGAFGMTMFGLYGPRLPNWLMLPCLLGVAAAGGAAWAVIPAWLKARRGAHEVISTMMMNFVAMAAINWLISTRFHDPETIHTAELPAPCVFPPIAAFERLFPGSAVNASIFLALGFCAIIAYFLWRTPLGFEWRAVGINPAAAKTSGVRVDLTLIGILLASGAVAGLAGANFVLGYKHYFEEGFASGAGFLGIAVALVARNNPIAVIPSAFLFAFLSQAGLTLNRWIPRELFEILQAGAILIIVIAQQKLGGNEDR